MSITVCICTFKRPDQLHTLLEHLNQRLTPVPGHPLHLVVVDNDPLHSARDTLAHWQQHGAWPLTALHAPQPNIALARNTAVGAACGDLLAFIDDDELPVPDWLLHLHRTLEQTQADVVFGPVLAVLPADVPRWLSEGRFFDRPRHPTGTAVGVHDARTGNALLRRQCLDGWSNPFDPAFGLSGGEDSLFFRDLLRRGKRFVWCDEAMVSEKVPEQRANTRWLLQRSYRIGQTWVRGELARLNGWELKRTWMALAVRSGVQLVVAAFLSLVLWPLSRIRGFRWLRTCVAQWGKLTGLVGQRFHEYSN